MLVYTPIYLVHTDVIQLMPIDMVKIRSWKVADRPSLGHAYIL